MPTPTERPALRLRVHISERDHHGGQPLYTAIVEAAQKAGLAGAVVLKGIEGFGRDAVVRAARIVDMASDLPIIVEVVDEPDAIRAFLPALGAMVAGALVTLDDVRIVEPAPGEAAR